MFENITKKHLIITLFITALLIVIVVGLLLGRSWAAWINSEQLVALAEQQNLPIKFGGVVITKKKMNELENCYLLLQHLVSNEQQSRSRQNSTDVIPEYINALLLEADMLENKPELQKEITEEAKVLRQIVNNQIERKGLVIEDLLSQYNLSLDAFTRCLREQAILRVTQDDFQAKTQVTAESVRKYYEDNMQDYYSSTKVEVAIATYKNKDQAHLVLQEVKNDVDFYEIVTKYNEDNQMLNNLNRYWIYQSQLVEELDKVIFDMVVGEIRGIVTTGAGYHIIKVEDRVEAQLQSFEEVETAVVADTLKFYSLMEWQQYVAQLRGKTKIVVWY